MKTNPKRTRCDTVQGKIKSCESAFSIKLEPPKHIQLRKEERPFWNSIIAARPHDLWNDSDLESAAILAACKAQVFQLQKEISNEENTITSGTRTVINPKHTLLETLIRRMIALSRVLHVHAESTIGRSRDSVNLYQEQNKWQRMFEGDEIAQQLIPYPGNKYYEE